MRQGHIGKETHRIITLTIGLHEYVKEDGRLEVHADAEGCDTYGRDTDEALRELFLELANGADLRIEL